MLRVGNLDIRMPPVVGGWNSDAARIQAHRDHFAAALAVAQELEARRLETLDRLKAEANARLPGWSERQTGQDIAAKSARDLAHSRAFDELLSRCDAALQAADAAFLAAHQADK